MPSSATDVLTPSQLNRQARTLLESHFDFIWIEGELSNFARPTSGHWYFTLKDDNAQVRCAMFRNKNQRLRFTPQNGEQVRFRARVSLYEGRGEFQLIGEFMELAGAGTLQAKFEALRDTLRAEGLFEASLKQALPRAIEHLAVITSPTGAALQDILHVLERRNPAIKVSVLPVAVQGEQAPRELCDAVIRANIMAKTRDDCDFDAIILARGGGSLEDLWAFNDEQLARNIAASDLPIVTGVGHEVDITIADFAADMRAPTPSAAAELLSEDRSELLALLTRERARLAQAMRGQLERAGLRLATARAGLRHPGDRLRERAQRLDGQEERLRLAVQGRLKDQRQSLEWLQQRLVAGSPHMLIERQREKLLRQRERAEQHIQQRLLVQHQELQRSAAVLESFNPLAVLARGYAIVTDEAGQAVRSAASVENGAVLSARLAQGELRLRAEQSEPSKS